MEKEPSVYEQLPLPGYEELLKPALSLNEMRRLTAFKARYLLSTVRKAEIRNLLESFFANLDSF